MSYDWSICDKVFEKLSLMVGGYTIDRFSCDYNRKCPRFNSRWWVPGCEGINALKQNWAGEVNWLVPPPRLIIDCLEKIKSEKCIGTIIIPEWRTASYWPDILNLIEIGRLKEIFKLPRDCITPGRGNNGIFKSILAFDMIALEICI